LIYSGQELFSYTGAQQTFRMTIPTLVLRRNDLANKRLQPEQHIFNAKSVKSDSSNTKLKMSYPANVIINPFNNPARGAGAVGSQAQAQITFIVEHSKLPDCLVKKGRTSSEGPMT
jgi:hypothetical protein